MINNTLIIGKEKSGKTRFIESLIWELYRSNSENYVKDSIAIIERNPNEDGYVLSENLHSDGIVTSNVFVDDLENDEDESATRVKYAKIAYFLKYADSVMEMRRNYLKMTGGSIRKMNDAIGESVFVIDDISPFGFWEEILSKMREARTLGIKFIVSVTDVNEVPQELRNFMENDVYVSCGSYEFRKSNIR